MDTLASGERVEITSTDPGFPRDAAAWCSSTGNQLISKDSSGGKSVVVIEKGEPKACNIVTSCEGKGKTFIMFSDDLEQSLGYFCTGKRRSSYGTKSHHLLHFLGTERYQEVTQTGNRKGYFRKNVWYDAASSSKKLKLSKMSMGGMGGK